MQQKRNFVLFQRVRLIWFGLKLSSKVGRYEKTQPKLAKAYADLVELVKEALLAIDNGRQDLFLKKLDALEEQRRASELDRLLAGKDGNLPSWLKK